MTPPSLPLLGAVLADRYRIVRALGEGGMGAVFEATHVHTGKQVAIKWLRPQLADNKEAAERLLREAQAASRVRHPNVVNIYDVAEAEGALFLVMEYLEGEPLSAWLERGGAPLPMLIRLLLQAMHGVAAAHRAGVIHRDINPSNIFLTRQAQSAEPTPKVLDFGISKIRDGKRMTLTQSGVSMGTPLYMSYEQLLSARDIDVRTDVYSFGVILYQAVTGQTPFAADSFAELAVKVATGTVIPAKQLRPDIPTPLDRLIAWAMEREREQRVPSLDALIQELTPFASERSFRDQMTLFDQRLPQVSPTQRRTTTPSPAGATGAPARAGTLLPRRRLATLLALSIVLAALLGSGLHAWQATLTPPERPAPRVPNRMQTPAPAAPPSTHPAPAAAPLRPPRPTPHTFTPVTPRQDPSAPPPAPLSPAPTQPRFRAGPLASDQLRAPPSDDAGVSRSRARRTFKARAGKVDEQDF